MESPIFGNGCLPEIIGWLTGRDEMSSGIQKQEDLEYFRRFAAEAAAKECTVENHYLDLQKEAQGDPRKIRDHLLPHQTRGVEMVVSELPGRASTLVVGCGTGSEIGLLQKSGFTALVGLDISPGRLELCRQRYGVETICADLRQTGLADASFQTVLARQSLHHLFYPFAALEEIARVSSRFVGLVSEPSRTFFKEKILRAVSGRQLISRARIYEYQFDERDVHRYMAFFGFEVRAFCRYFEVSGLPYPLHRLLNLVTPLRNRFTAIYERFET